MAESGSGSGSGSGAEPKMAPRQAEWKHIEERYWKQVADIRKNEDHNMHSEFDSTTKGLRIELVELYGERTRLAEQLLAARTAIEEKENLLAVFESKMANKQVSMAKLRAEQDDFQRDFFAQHRKPDTAPTRTPPDERDVFDGPSEHTTNDYPTNGAVQHRDSVATAAALSTPARETLPSTPVGQVVAAALSNANSREPSHSSDGLGDIEILRSDGGIISRVRHMDVEDPWAADWLNRPILRPVVARPDTTFTEQQLEIVPDGEQSTRWWVSFQIQATGGVQGRPCDSCRQLDGPFSQCVAVGGGDYAGCGNCHWTGQACTGAALHATEMHHLQERPKLHQALSHAETPLGPHPRPQPTPGTQPTSGFTPVNNPVQTPPATAMMSRPSPTAALAKQRRSLPDGKASKQSSKQSTPLPGAEQAGHQQEQEIEPPAEPEITKETLSLVHDGMVFLEPEIMRGVPVKKITKEHPYWEEGWKSIEEIIQPKLDEWTARQEKYKEKSDQPDKHAKFLAGRQVNRGNCIMRFMASGDVHPYQIVAKEWITSGLTNYDTLHRLCQTLEELPKFNLDVTPVEWLRQRLHERYMEEQETFKLDKVVHNLYHDSKLTALRARNGFGNIGRPSGYKAKSGDGGSGRKSRTEKRKEAPTSARSTPKKRNSSVVPGDGPLLAPAPPGFVHGAAALAPSPQPSHKKPRPNAQVPPPPPLPNFQDGPGYDQWGLPLDPNAEELAYLGYTSSDSFSMDRVMSVDWRVYQIKTARLTSNTEITQYWHWIDAAREDNGERIEQMFEHQVLKDVDPTSWGVYKEPINFHLRLRELTEIQFARGSPKIVIGTKELPGLEYRGPILAHFKRERTKRRFLSFMKRQNVVLVEKAPKFINDAWDNMKSEVLPDSDSE